MTELEPGAVAALDQMSSWAYNYIDELVSIVHEMREVGESESVILACLVQSTDNVLRKNGASGVAGTMFTAILACMVIREANRGKTPTEVGL